MDERSLVAVHAARLDFFHYVEEWESGGTEEADETELSRPTELEAESYVRWFRTLEQSVVRVRDEVNRETLKDVFEGRALQQRDAGEHLHLLHCQRRWQRGMKPLGKASHAVRVGTRRLGYLDGQAVLNMAAVAVAESKELLRYWAANSYRAAHEIAFGILSRRELVWMHKTGGKVSKFRPVLRAHRLNAWLS